jgi:[ribosomal protein S5]-alanine N-acetyltransferase
LVFLRSPFVQEQAPHLRNGRVMLRHPVLNDFEAWVDLRQASRGFLQPWEPLWTTNEFSKFNFRARIKHYQQQIRDDASYPFFVFHHEEGHLLGAVTASNVRRGVAQMCSVGYWMGESFTRQGYMTEALAALLDHAFGDLALHRVEAACLAQNTASIKLLQRNGFLYEGVARKYLQIAGNWQDHMLFARLAGHN